MIKYNPCDCKRCLDECLPIHIKSSLKSYQCSFCPKASGQLTGLKLHLEKKHKKEHEEKIANCNRGIKLSSISWSKGKKCDCKRCTEMNLDTHEPETEFQCGTCNYRISKESKLFGPSGYFFYTKHSCGKERDYKNCLCKICVETNRKEHNQEEGFQCNFCPYVTSTGISKSKSYWMFKLHSKQHTKPAYNCNYCAFETATDSKLRKHCRSMHPKESSHKCERCPFEAAYRANLERHKCLIYPCYYCEFETCFLIELNLHAIEHNTQ